MAISLIIFQRLMIGLVAKKSLLCYSFIGKCHKAKFQFVAEQAGLNITLSETKKTGFFASRPN